MSDDERRLRDMDEKMDEKYATFCRDYNEAVRTRITAEVREQEAHRNMLGQARHIAEWLVHPEQWGKA